MKWIWAVSEAFEMGLGQEIGLWQVEVRKGIFGELHSVGKGPLRSGYLSTEQATQEMLSDHLGATPNRVLNQIFMSWQIRRRTEMFIHCLKFSWLIVPGVHSELSLNLVVMVNQSQLRKFSRLLFSKESASETFLRSQLVSNLHQDQNFGIGYKTFLKNF